MLTFIQSHPLLDGAVPHNNDKPVFYKRDLIFTHVVVDKVTSGTFGSQREYTVYYAGSSEYLHPSYTLYLECTGTQHNAASQSTAPEGAHCVYCHSHFVRCSLSRLDMVYL